MMDFSKVDPGVIALFIILGIALLFLAFVSLAVCKSWICPKKTKTMINRRLVFNSINDNDMDIKEYDDYRNIYEDDDDLYCA